MAWLTEAEFKALYVTESATEISSAQIGQCLDEAIDELATLCGSTVADEIAEASDNTLVKVRKFRRAQSKLAYRELLLLMSSRFRNGGIMVQERDENAVTTNQYESFEKTEARRKSLYTEALRIIEIYLAPNAEDTSTGSIEFSHPVQDPGCCSS